jgi:IS5 family transposase
LATVIPAMEDMIGNTIERLLADAGYRGHNAPIDYKFRVYTSGQKRRLTPQIKRELRRRAAIEPVIGHSQGRAPHGPQLSCKPCRRCR